MVCAITDFRCVWVNELIGDPKLAVIIAGIIFFAFASYKRLSFRTTAWVSCVFFPVVSYFVAGTTFVFALMTLVAALLLSFLHTFVIGNR